MGVPTFYTRLLANPDFDRDACAHMRLFISGSAPMLEQTHHEFTERTGHRILERYGMTECGMSTSNPLDGERKVGTVGPPLPGVSLRVVDDAGKAVATGEIGQIEFKGPNVFQGYWRMPEKTAEDFTEDGYFRSGDLGTLDEDGYVSIVGRDKDLIISGGYNVYPKEVEICLDGLDSVDESAVIGVPDKDFGERVVAVVVPRGTAPNDDAGGLQASETGRGGEGAAAKRHGEGSEERPAGSFKEFLTANYCSAICTRNPSIAFGNWVTTMRSPGCSSGLRTNTRAPPSTPRCSPTRSTRTARMRSFSSL
jgi:malonyl-CoA/methylmalonyl-CoA synthetase